MKRWFQSAASRIRLRLQGCYGTDELSRTMLWVSIVLMLISVIFRVSILNTIALIILLWSMFRSYSKNIYKRREEREKWLKFTGNVKSWFSLQKRKWKERHDYKYFRCKKCKAVMRVPRGKGTVRVNCRKCHSEMIKKT